MPQAFFQLSESLFGAGSALAGIGCIDRCVQGIVGEKVRIGGAMFPAHTGKPKMMVSYLFASN